MLKSPLTGLFLVASTHVFANEPAVRPLCPQPGSAECPAIVTVTSSPSEYVSIPDSFLGFSQEWPWVGSMTGSEHIFSIFEQLRAGKAAPLMLRLGGADADAGWDRMQNPLHKDYHHADNRMRRDGYRSTFQELGVLRDKVGFKVIATVNLANRNLDLTLDQASKLRSVLGDTLISLEIGNEPNYYLSHVPEYWPNTQTFYSDIVSEFDRFGAALGCDKNCSGPAWGWIGLRPDMMRNYLNKSAPKLNYVTVHYYKSAYKPGQPNNDTVETLIEETDIISKWIKPQVAVSREYGVPLRIAESNAVSGGGHDGVSNSYAAALWTLDTCLSMAAAGAAGIDFHQGSYKYAMYKRIMRNAGDEQNLPLSINYKVQPSFYGMLFFQMANRDRSSIAQLTTDPASKIKAYQLRSPEGQRTVLINKDGNQAKTVTLLLPAATSMTLEHIELAAPENNLAATQGITIAGQSYDGWGAEVSGTYFAPTLTTRAANTPGYQSVQVTLRPASAVMLQSK